MKIILATGIYPPDIGGPATYTAALAKELAHFGHNIVVLTYADDASDSIPESTKGWEVVRVSKKGGSIARWMRYAKALKKHAKDADIIYAFSSVSCGVPLKMARLSAPMKILRLGGDFLWERYTDAGGKKGLAEWYASAPKSQLYMQKLLGTFHHIVFSTEFQQKIYEKYFRVLPEHSVIENARTRKHDHIDHQPHTPFRILFMGRLVRFKNVKTLITALTHLPDATLTIVGDGPALEELQEHARAKKLEDRVLFLSAVQHEKVPDLLAQEDLLVIPSLTEISPNMALEARSAGLPILLSKDTGLSPSLSEGMTLAPLKTSRQIVAAVQDVRSRYDDHVHKVADHVPERSWHTVAKETLNLFETTLLP